MEEECAQWERLAGELAESENYYQAANQYKSAASCYLDRVIEMTRKAAEFGADAALVVAKGVAELKKWLQTDRSVRVADKQDKCRLGYVAFTRPREMLCIACLKELDTELIQMLQNLGIVTVAGYDAGKGSGSEAKNALHE